MNRASAGGERTSRFSHFASRASVECTVPWKQKLKSSKNRILNYLCMCSWGGGGRGGKKDLGHKIYWSCWLDVRRGLTLVMQMPFKGKPARSGFMCYFCFEMYPKDTVVIGRRRTACLRALLCFFAVGLLASQRRRGLLLLSGIASCARAAVAIGTLTDKDTTKGITYTRIQIRIQIHIRERYFGQASAFYK